MTEKFKTLFFVKSSLISLYLALTIPIPFISIDKLKIISLISFVIGLYLIINITNDYVETCDNKISYKTSFISKTIGRKNWEITWKDIKLIKSFPTSQGSKVFYFNTIKDENFLIPQRVENFEKFLLVVSKRSGIAINPDTPINKLENYIEKVDLICLMGVHAGFGGQKFIEKTFDRLVELKSLIKTKNSSALIEIDGGVDNTNNVKLKSLGADVLVAGSYIFKSSDINKAISSLK